MGVSLKIRMVCVVEISMVWIVRFEWCTSLKLEWVYVVRYVVYVVEIGMGVLLVLNVCTVEIGMGVCC